MLCWVSRHTSVSVSVAQCGVRVGKMKWNRFLRSDFYSCSPVLARSQALCTWSLAQSWQGTQTRNPGESCLLDFDMWPNENTGWMEGLVDQALSGFTCLHPATLICPVLFSFFSELLEKKFSWSLGRPGTALWVVPFCFSSSGPSQFAVFQEMSLSPKRVPVEATLCGGQSRASCLTSSSSSLTSRHIESVQASTLGVVVGGDED